MDKIIKAINQFLLSPPSFKDAIILTVFTILITFHPYYLNDRINVFELGLYLPGINAIQHGLVPYRDFFHLRGPLEIYAPTWLMNIFGTHMGVLCSYFFFGNVLCLIFLVFIAKELVKSRFMLYLMIPVIIARTYPRVVFMIWGGMRYAFGLIAVYCFIRFIKNRQTGWIIATGFITALAALTSIEIGIYVAATVAITFIVAGLSGFIPARQCWRSFLYFTIAGLVGISPWIIYSVQQHAFFPYLEAVWTIVTRLHTIFNDHLVSIFPSNFPEAFVAMTNPVSINFKQMTPSYMYLFLLGYLIWRWCKRSWSTSEIVLLSLGVFGFIMYNTGFRGLWAAQFEMSLMPEKVLYFFLVEVGLLWLWSKMDAGSKAQKVMIVFLVIVLFASSWGYAISRYNHRFLAYQYVFNPKDRKNLKFRDKGEMYARIDIQRAKGIWVPVDQQRDLNQIEKFIQTQTLPSDKIVMFPEMGMYNFLFDRPFVGRFPITTFSWFQESWFSEYISQLKQKSAKYIIVQKKMPSDWYKVYLGYPPNKEKYDEIVKLIQQEYAPIAQTDATEIYQRKE